MFGVPFTSIEPFLVYIFELRLASYKIQKKVREYPCGCGFTYIYQKYSLMFWNGQDVLRRKENTVEKHIKPNLILKDAYKSNLECPTDQIAIISKFDAVAGVTLASTWGFCLVRKTSIIGKVWPCLILIVCGLSLTSLWFATCNCVLGCVPC
jgi:hypothetical protein